MVIAIFMERHLRQCPEKNMFCIRIFYMRMQLVISFIYSFLFNFLFIYLFLFIFFAYVQNSFPSIFLKHLFTGVEMFSSASTEILWETYLLHYEYYWSVCKQRYRSPSLTYTYKKQLVYKYCKPDINHNTMHTESNLLRLASKYSTFE